MSDVGALFRLRSRGWTAAGLATLSVVPLLAGLYRIYVLASGHGGAADQRFIDHPMPVLLHIGAMGLYVPLAPLQFWDSIRRRWPRAHRTVGGVLIVSAVIIAGSGLWMTWSYPRVGDDSAWISFFRWMAGLGLLFCLGRSVEQLLRRRFLQHGEWMIRAYAVAMGAGTQVFTHIVFIIVLGFSGQFGRILVMGGGWIINVLVAEYFITKNRRSLNQ